MKRNNLFLILVPVIALLCGGSFFVWNSWNKKTAPKNVTENVSENVPLQEPQCAHWSILRCCQLLGAPVTLQTLLKMLPPQDEGHSMLQITEALQKIGFETEGRRENLASLAKGSFPCIARLTYPSFAERQLPAGHFVVVSGMDDDYVHVFDGNGHRTARAKESFDSSWTGEILQIKKPNSTKRLPIFLPDTKPNTPQIQFDHLIVDLGTVPAVGDPVQFAFPFKNTGTADLEITEVRPECSCIKKEVSAAKIAPGETGSINLSYHIQPNSGTFLHDILVTTNDPQLSGIVLNASGWSGAAVTVYPPTRVIPNLLPNQEKKVYHFIRYTGDAADFQAGIADKKLNNLELLQPSVVPVTQELWNEHFPSIPIKKQNFPKIYLLEFTVRSDAKIGETVNGRITLATNLRGYEKVGMEIFAVITAPVKAFPEVVILNKNHPQQTVRLMEVSDVPCRIMKAESAIPHVDVSLAEKEVKIKASDFSPASGEVNIQIEYGDKKECYTVPIKVLIE